MLYIYIMLSALLSVFAISKPLLMPIVFIGAMLGFVILHTLFLVLQILLVNLKKPARDSVLFRKTVKGFLSVAFSLLGIKVHISGLEKVPQKERFLLVCNHIHDFDPAMILYALPESRLAFIAKKEVEQLFPIIFKALHKMHGLPIDRENDREAVKTIIKATHLIKNDENSVAVFPEGYTSLTGELQPLRNGALKIATKTQSKIVVCTLVGTREILKNLFRRRSDVYFDVVDVIDTAGVTRHTSEIGEEIYNKMKASIQNRRNT